MTWKRRFQNVGLITLIAVLVWLYAEGEGVQELALDVVLQVPEQFGDDLVVDLVRPEDRPIVTIVLRGNASRLSETRALLGPAPRLRLPLEPDDLPVEKIGTVSLMPLLADAHLGPGSGPGPSFSSLGVSVVTVDPPTIQVSWERLVKQTLKVRFQTDGVELAAGARVEPAEVEATIPQELARRYAGSEDVFFVEARISDAVLRDMPEGVERTVPAQLALSPVLQGKEHVSLPTQTAYVTFAVARQRATATLDAVPVWLLAPPSELQRFDIQLNDESRVLRNVAISASRELIGRLQNSGDLRVVARLELTGDDLERGISSALITMIEIQEVRDGTTRTVEVVPLNPEALEPGADGSLPSFTSSNVSIRTARPEVDFTVTRKTP